jgi:hypothetical protein
VAPAGARLADVRPAGALTAERPLLVQHLFDPAQRSAQGLRIRARAAQRQRGLELSCDGISYYLQRFRCVSLHSAALHCVRCAID